MATAPTTVNASLAALETEAVLRLGAPMATPPAHRSAERALVRYALAFPEAAEEWPWDERVIKVRGKIFVFLGMLEGTLRVGVKLPVSHEMALTLPYCTPTGYGLGRAGWITARFTPRQKPDVSLLKAWIDQSYRAVAPRRLAASLPPMERS
jgi:predicted DNA-binding protein (MmcQ/YjbR family)